MYKTGIWLIDFEKVENRMKNGKKKEKIDRFWQSMGRKVYDINCGFRAVPLEQEVLWLSKKVWSNGSTMYFTYKFVKIHTYKRHVLNM